LNYFRIPKRQLEVLQQGQHRTVVGADTGFNYKKGFIRGSGEMPPEESKPP